jgi:uncharacterized membrane protein
MAHLIQDGGIQMPSETEPKKPREVPATRPKDVRGTAAVINLANIIGIFAGVVFGILGVALVYLGSRDAESIVTLFGQEIKTSSVGVACIFIGAVTAIMTIRRTFNSLDEAIRR